MRPSCVDVKRTSTSFKRKIMHLARLYLLRTLFLRLFSENGQSLLCRAIIRAAYRSTKQFVGLQGNSTIKPLFNQKTEKSSFADFFT